MAGTQQQRKPLTADPKQTPNHVRDAGQPQHWEFRALLFSNSVSVRTLLRLAELWDGAYGLSSLSEKTRESSHLQTELQRLNFHLSYLKCIWHEIFFSCFL